MAADPTGDPHDLGVALAAAKAGDELAFRLIYRAQQPALLRYLSVLVGADAEDVASEAWLKIARDLRAFQGDWDGFRGWAATVARHRAMDHRRRVQRRPVSAGPVELLAADLPAPHDPADEALKTMDTDAAVALIGSLPRDQAEAVMLRAVVGLDAETAGRVLGKRAGAVRTAAYRGLRTLSRRLDQNGGIPGRKWVRDPTGMGMAAQKGVTLRTRASTTSIGPSSANLSRAAAGRTATASTTSAPASSSPIRAVRPATISTISTTPTIRTIPTALRTAPPTPTTSPAEILRRARPLNAAPAPPWKPARGPAASPATCRCPHRRTGEGWVPGPAPGSGPTS